MAKKKARKKAARKKAAKKRTTRRRSKGKKDKFHLDLTEMDSPSIPKRSSSHGAHGSGSHSVVISGERHARHQGHDVLIKTSYEITVDGKPFGGHVELDNRGQLYTHACPYNEFASAMDMMKHIIEAYPEAFAHDEAAPHEEAHA